MNRRRKRQQAVQSAILIATAAWSHAIHLNQPDLSPTGCSAFTTPALTTRQRRTNAVFFSAPSSWTTKLTATAAGTTTGDVDDALRQSNNATSQQVRSSPSKFFTQHRRYHHQQSLSPNEFIITYLEINGFLLTTYDGITVLIDPILDGKLDFGIPHLYSASKKALPSKGLIDQLPPIDCLLLTQGLDDHAHVQTLTSLARSGKLLNVPILAPPSAREALQQSGLFTKTNKLNVGFLKHGEKWTITLPPPSTTSRPGINSRNSVSNGLTIQATKGALVGPPWQARENGYILSSCTSTSKSSSFSAAAGPSIYIEPHVEFNVDELQRVGPVDVVISPIEGQRIGSVFDLVYGSDRTVQLVETLRPKAIIPMTNGNIEASGPVSSIVSTNGSEQEFRRRLETTGLSKSTRIEKLIPGEDQFIRL